MSLSGMVESPRQPDVIKKILQHLETVGCQALVIWYFLLRPPGSWTCGFLLMNFLHTEPEKHIIKADTIVTVLSPSGGKKWNRA